MATRAKLSKAYYRKELNHYMRLIDSVVEYAPSSDMRTERFSITASAAKELSAFLFLVLQYIEEEIPNEE